jgi:hypothetical protein
MRSKTGPKGRRCSVKHPGVTVFGRIIRCETLSKCVIFPAMTRTAFTGTVAKELYVRLYDGGGMKYAPILFQVTTLCDPLKRRDPQPLHRNYRRRGGTNRLSGALPP